MGALLQLADFHLSAGALTVVGGFLLRLELPAILPVAQNRGILHREVGGLCLFALATAAQALLLHFLVQTPPFLRQLSRNELEHPTLLVLQPVYEFHSDNVVVPHDARTQDGQSFFNRATPLLLQGEEQRQGFELLGIEESEMPILDDQHALVVEQSRLALLEEIDVVDCVRGSRPLLREDILRQRLRAQLCSVLHIYYMIHKYYPLTASVQKGSRGASVSGLKEDLIIRKQKQRFYIINYFHGSMRTRYKLLQQLRREPSLNAFFEQEAEADNQPNYQIAKEVLMSIPDDPEVQREQGRRANNGSQISRWNQQGLCGAGQVVGRRKEHAKHRSRHILSQNSFTESEQSQFSMGFSLKKEFHKLQLPLKEKNINCEQLRESVLEKERTRTRKEIKLDIINSKMELAPALPKKKLQPEHNCENIIKFRTDSHHYQKIRRRGFYTIEIDPEAAHEHSFLNSIAKTRHKAFFYRQQIENQRHQGSTHLFIGQ